MYSFALRPTSRSVFAILLAACLAQAGRANAEELPKGLFPDAPAVAGSMRVNDLLASPFYAKVKAKLPQEGVALDHPLHEKSSLTLNDVATVAIAGDAPTNSPVLVLQLCQEAEESSFNVGSNDKSETVADVDLFAVDKFGSGCLIGQQTLLLGPVESLRGLLRRDGESQLPPKLQAAWNGLDEGAVLRLVATGEALTRSLGTPSAAGGLFHDTAKKIRTVAVTIDVKESLVLRVVCDCEDEASVAAVDGLLNLATVFLLSGAPAEVQSAWQERTVEKRATQLALTLNLDADAVAYFVKPLVAASAGE